MPYVTLVTLLALLEFLWFGYLVAKARVTLNMPAPATTGNETFERYFRVQMNTLEQLIIFLPALWIFARYISPIWAAALGVVFIIGRGVYAAAYIRDPKSRSLGVALTSIPMLLLLAGIGIWAIRAILLGAGAL